MVYPLCTILSTQDLLMILGITGARCILPYVIVRILHGCKIQREREEDGHISLIKMTASDYLINIKKDQPINFFDFNPILSI